MPFSYLIHIKTESPVIETDNTIYIASKFIFYTSILYLHLYFYIYSTSTSAYTLPQVF